MCKSVLYRVYYEENGEKINIISVCKAAVFEDEATAFLAKEKLNENEKLKEESRPQCVHTCYGCTQQAGAWPKQQEALYNAAKNGGLYMIR